MAGAHDAAGGKPKDGGGKYSLLQAIGLNTMNMFGTGPLITIPYCLASVDPAGPHAMIGYGVACAACVCDSLVWGEIGSMWPEIGGSYVYLRELYGPQTFGRLASFMFIWQFVVSGPAELASGFIAIAEYLAWFSPDTIDYWPRVLISLAALAVCAALLFQRVEDIGRVAVVLWAVTVAAIVFVLASGFSSWDAGRLASPPGALSDGSRVVWTIATATRFGVYDMTGYYDVCFIGGQVERPRRTIPLSCISTCVVVAVVYIAVYLAVLGALPWESFIDNYGDNATGVSPGIISVFTDRRFGSSILTGVVTVVVAVTILASTFSMLCGFASLPAAAARDGTFFSVFGHESTIKPGLSDVSLLSVVLLSAVWCFVELELVIEAMTTMLVLMQFSGQAVGLMVYRYRTPKELQPDGWRMPLYPLPCILQVLIFMFIWVTSDSVVLWGDDDPVLDLSVLFLLAGVAVFFARAKVRNEWPFEPKKVLPEPCTAPAHDVEGACTPRGIAVEDVPQAP
eukprot:TRINITY_DN12531_c0_g1_i1.p1 TRINITY_DN12531_c0_g1~~TRINITY_DN12531_c0_g1_i1.p1  ORF type:complete len:511 (+),score=118.41 TRINITY_DN12531_c0_g1_i1:51-1583(+)